MYPTQGIIISGDVGGASNALRIWKKEPRNPLPYPNEVAPSYNDAFLNTSTGELFIMSDCDGLKKWVGMNETIIYPEGHITYRDFFNDGSCIAMFNFDKNFNDEEGGWHVSEVLGSPYLSDGYIGKAYTGSANSALKYNTKNFGLSTDFSIFFYMNREPTNDQECIFIFSRGGQNTLNIFAKTNTERRMIVIVNGNTNYVHDTDICDGEWHSICYSTVNNGSVFVDGEEKATNIGIVDLQQCDYKFLLGADRDGTYINDYYKGKIDLFRIFNRGITFDEYLSLINAQTC
jgi:hypothetical protein